MIGRRKTTVIIGIIAATAMGFLMGAATVGQSYAQKKDVNPYERLDIFAQVLSVIERNYVDTADRTAMIDGAIKGMIRALDPHSSFMTGEERAEFERRTDGKFVGIGVELGIRDDELRVIAAFYGGPAQKAGIESGDVIVSIDGKDVSSMSLDALFDALRGAPQSTVRLTVRRAGHLSLKTHVIERAVVALDLVRTQIVSDDFGYIALKSFGNGAAEKVKEAIERLKTYAPGGLNGIILDLRKNPGGFVHEGVAVANLFVKSGNIVTTRGRGGILIKSYDAARSGYAYDYPLAVLIDEGTASAAEIVAGALQDHHRAIIVGQTSFGKASIQSLFSLSDGSTVKLTIGRYYTPSGNCIQARGITPDVEVEDLILQRKPRSVTREKDLDHALSAAEGSKSAPGGGAAQPNSTAVQTPAAPAAPAFDPEEPLPSIDDLQLFTAIQQLRARRFYLPDA